MRIPRERVKVDNQWIETLLAWGKRWNPVLVVVDCHYMASTKNTKASEDIQEVIANYMRLRDELNCVVVVIHHTNKGAGGRRASTDEGSGAVTLAQACDSVFQLKKSQTEKETRILVSTGQREFDEQAFGVRALRLNGDTKWFEDKGETTEEEHMQKDNAIHKPKIDVAGILADMPRHTAPRQALVEKTMELTGKQKSTIYTAVQKAIDCGEIFCNRFDTVTTEAPVPPPAAVTKGKRGKKVGHL